MTDVGIGELLARMLVSLAVVLGLVFLAYTVLRRRQGHVPSGASRLRLLGGGSAAPAKPQNDRRGVHLIARVGVSRTSQLVAVQFAERVLLVGASDNATPQVLAEIDIAAWREHTTAPEPIIVREPIASITAGAPASRPTVPDTLRELTARRA